MTLSTLDKVLQPANMQGEAVGARSMHARAAFRYLIAAAACILFAFVYAQFSHGVHSPFMTLMFAIPLVGGAVPALGMHVVRARPVPRFARQAWALSLASLSITSCLRGIFEIAGTGSSYLVVYLMAAGVLAVIAVVSLARSHV